VFFLFDAVDRHARVMRLLIALVSVKVWVDYKQYARRWVIIIAAVFAAPPQNIIFNDLYLNGL
jgi:hypothetical protein